MVTVWVCSVVLAVIAFIEAVVMYVLIAKVWGLEDELSETRAIEPIIDEDGRWQSWDG